MTAESANTSLGTQGRTAHSKHEKVCDVELRRLQRRTQILNDVIESWLSPLSGGSKGPSKTDQIDKPIEDEDL